jgi:hypothetical protein
MLDSENVNSGIGFRSSRAGLGWRSAARSGYVVSAMDRQQLVLGCEGFPIRFSRYRSSTQRKLGAMGGDTSVPYTEGFDSSAMAAVE